MGCYGDFGNVVFVYADFFEYFKCPLGDVGIWGALGVVFFVKGKYVEFVDGEYFIFCCFHIKI